MYRRYRPLYLGAEISTILDLRSICQSTLHAYCQSICQFTYIYLPVYTYQSATTTSQYATYNFCQDLEVKSNQCGPSSETLESDHGSPSVSFKLLALSAGGGESVRHLLRVDSVERLLGNAHGRSMDNATSSDVRVEATIYKTRERKLD